MFFFRFAKLNILFLSLTNSFYFRFLVKTVGIQPNILCFLVVLKYVIGLIIISKSKKPFLVNNSYLKRTVKLVTIS